MDFYLDDFEEYKRNNNWTAAISAAISKMKKGDRLIFGENKTYTSGTIFIRSGITFYFEKNALLKASDTIDDFNVTSSKVTALSGNTFDNCDYNGKPTLYFIYGINVSDFKIEGNGVIDGNEEIFYGEVKDTYIEGAFYPRMPLIYIENGKNIELHDITLRKSAFWTVHLVGCNGVLVDGISILNNRLMLNADGIDPDHSKNIVIRNSKIESADDCIVFKGTKANQKYGDTCNILVENCDLKSSSAAIKIGTETFAHFHDMEFKNIRISDTNRGISLQLRDTGSIDHLKFDNIMIETHMFDKKAFWGKAEAIAVTSSKRTLNTQNGSISHLEFTNIKTNSEHGIFIYGDNNISDISFENISVHLKNITEESKDIYDLRPGVITLFEEKNALMYVHGAEKIDVSDYDFDLNGLDAIPYCGNVQFH